MHAMIFDKKNRLLNEIEYSQDIIVRRDVFSKLRELSLEEFGEVIISMPDPKYPKISNILPYMASVEVQKNWTGASGKALLRQTCDFVKSLVSSYQMLGCKAMADSKILDYGCGYGRIARLIYYFAEEDRVFGVDPWDKSIELCRSARLGENFIISDYLPEEIPNDIRFDLAYAFSVFTHLSMNAAIASFKALRRAANSGAVLCITIRPPEFWDQPHPDFTPDQGKLLKNQQIESGFAFIPHYFNALDNGGSTYGDTGMSVEWIHSNINFWKIIRTDKSVSDPYQIYVYLMPS